MLRWLLLANAMAALGYAVGLVAIPTALADLDMGPESVAWTRYLVPIYVALAIASWVAFRRPHATRGIALALVTLWSGLVLAHLANMALGDEPISPTTVGLLVFDAVMAVALGVALIATKPAQEVEP